MILWEAKYETGVKEIDHQHQWLFDFANDLERELNNNADKANVHHILTKLEEYAQKHFQFEESCMNKWKCPFANENQCAHKNFVYAYENFMERYKREGQSEELAWKIHHMVERWIVNHICRIDLKLRETTITN